jgi:hypothetical protein
MKKLMMQLIAAALVAGALGGCEFLIGPNEPVGSGNLVISLGGNSSRAITSGAELPEDVLNALYYEFTLAGPGGETLTRTVTGEATINLTVALGLWQIEARAYKDGGLAGTKSIEIKVGPGINTIDLPMEINGGYFNITVDSPINNGKVESGFAAAFPGATVTLTVTPDAGFTLKSGSLKYSYGGTNYIPEGSGPTYTFAMPASDVTVGAFFNKVTGTITIEGPQDEVIPVTWEKSPGSMYPDKEISWSGDEWITFTAAGYTSGVDLKWFREGEEDCGTGDSYTINAKEFLPRVYSITVMVQVNGLWYSATDSIEIKP